MTTLTSLTDADITYCEGSLLLQTTPTTDIGTVLLQRPNGTLVCQHCYLVVADAQDIKTIAPDQDWSLLVSCHVQACGSLHDRRAAYCCYACLERGKMAVEPNMSKLREHLNVCELVRLSETQRRRREPSRKGKARADLQSVPPAEASPIIQPAPTSARNSASNPYRKPSEPQPAPATQPAYSNFAWPEETNPPLPTRPKSGAPPGTPTSAQRMYTPQGVLRPAEQPTQASGSRPVPQDMYNIPGGFPGQPGAPNDSRTSTMHDYTPTVPRRKDVRSEAPSNAPPPSQPSRAPPAPPVLSPPAPPAYYQGKDAHAHQQQQPTPSSPFDGRGSADSFSTAEAAKIQQLVSLGIPRLDAEYLLNRTGGDVNAAAELQLSEMGSLGGPGHQGNNFQGGPGAFSNPLGSNPPDRRNRRSK
jgi:hypothetical protein